jgi:hypothetical protein
MTDYLEKCSICGTPFKSSIFRGRHLKQEHEMSLEDYVVKTVYNGIKPKCKCGCGKDLIFAEKLKGTWYYEYVYNHSPRKQPSEETKKKMVEDRKKTNLVRYGHECSAQSEVIKEKIKKTNLERYGYEHPMQNEKIYDKVKNTLKDRYGIENPMQNEEFRQKAIEFNKVKYGVENVFQNEEIKTKSKKTNLEKYGVEHASQSDEVKKKTVETNIERYGSKHHFDVPEIYAKVIKTNLERYGVEHPLQSSVLFEKMKKDNIQKYGFEYTAQVEEFKNKTHVTNLKRYGNKSPFGNKDVQKKSKETSLERYGVEYPIQNKDIFKKSQDTLFENHGVRYTFHKLEFYNKVMNTNLERYGFSNPMQNEDIREKVKQTNLIKYGVESPFQMTNFKKLYNSKHSKKELEICNILDGESSFEYMGKEYDIKVGNNLFEIDGDYWHADNLLNLNLIKICSISNDFKKIKDIENSPYKLYKILISNLPKEITVENLIENSYVPNFELNYEDVIVSKQYLKTIIDREGKEYLEKYLKYFLTFIKTFQPTFPYHKSKDAIEEIKKIIFNYNKFDTIFNKETKVFNNMAYTIGTTYLKAMFHSYWKSSFRGNKSPVQMWENEKDMTNIIKYRIGLNNSGEIYDFSLKNLVKGISAVRGTISFFKPIVAACIYKEFLKDFSQNDAPKVFDPCCGFGGRMLGFKSSFPNGIYVGCEPNVETYNELLELSKNFTNVTIYNCKVEELILENYDFDLSFTSIPYFDLEEYSNVMEYNNIEVWKDTFIKSLYKFPNLLLNIPKDLENCFENVLDKYYLKNNVSKHLAKKNSEEKYELILKFF